MNIALVGYGKMGKAVEQIATQRGHIITFRIDRDRFGEIERINPTNTDVVIDFSHPQILLPNVEKLLQLNLPIVVGTTGWYGSLPDIQKMVFEKQGAFLYASNFSIGVNLFFKINSFLAQFMDKHPQYDCFVEERHHKHKMDAPSGSALTLANGILAHLKRKKCIILANELTNRHPTDDELSLAITRAGEITGQHRVVYTSPIDKIEILHEAYSREGFAIGALTAAEWLHGRTGFFEFAEVL